LKNDLYGIQKIVSKIGDEQKKKGRQVSFGEVACKNWSRAMKKFLQACALPLLIPCPPTFQSLPAPMTRALQKFS